MKIWALFGLTIGLKLINRSNICLKLVWKWSKNEFLWKWSIPYSRHCKGPFMIGHFQPFIQFFCYWISACQFNVWNIQNGQKMPLKCHFHSPYNRGNMVFDLKSNTAKSLLKNCFWKLSVRKIPKVQKCFEILKSWPRNCIILCK